jgi:hypothetical protein
MEMPYVFDHLDQQRVAWTAQDRKLASILPAYWTNFAATGDPNGPGLPQWPQFNPSTQQVMMLGDTIGPEDIPDQGRLRRIDAVYASARFVVTYRYALLVLVIVVVVLAAAAIVIAVRRFARRRPRPRSA